MIPAVWLTYTLLRVFLLLSFFLILSPYIPLLMFHSVMVEIDWLYNEKWLSDNW